jgi:hypothetical protein
VRDQASALGITPWGSQVEEKLPEFLCSVGSARLPSTTDAIARFSGPSSAVSAPRGGFHIENWYT